MSEAGDDRARMEAAYDFACDLYDQLSKALAETVAMMQRRAELETPLTKEERDLMRDHQKAILTILGFEQELWRKHGPADPVGAILDLEAARREVAGRLARLAERKRA